jgi:hypothetical protein
MLQSSNGEKHDCLVCHCRLSFEQNIAKIRKNRDYWDVTNGRVKWLVMLGSAHSSCPSIKASNYHNYVRCELQSYNKPTTLHCSNIIVVYRADRATAPAQLHEKVNRAKGPSMLGLSHHSLKALICLSRWLCKFAAVNGDHCDQLWSASTLSPGGRCERSIRT